MASGARRSRFRDTGVAPQGRSGDCGSRLANEEGSIRFFPIFLYARITCQLYMRMRGWRNAATLRKHYGPTPNLSDDNMPHRAASYPANPVPGDSAARNLRMSH
jgi:hypothetical protein